MKVDLTEGSWECGNSDPGERQSSNSDDDGDNIILRTRVRKAKTQEQVESVLKLVVFFTMSTYIARSVAPFSYQILVSWQFL